MTLRVVLGAVVGPFTALRASRPGKHPSCRQDSVVAGGCRKSCSEWHIWAGLEKQCWRRGDAALLQPICAHSRARGEDGVLCYWSPKVKLTLADSALWGTETLGEVTRPGTFSDDETLTKKVSRSKSYLYITLWLYSNQRKIIFWSYWRM